MEGNMEEEMPPRLMSYALTYRQETAREKELRTSYNWKMTDEGWLRMDKKQPSTPKKPKDPTALEFLGQCYDEDEHFWMKCFVFREDASIRHPDKSFHKVQSTAGDVDIDLDKALGLVANASKAAGVIYILCGDNLWERLSGFFVNDKFFLTCAHFGATTDAEEEMKRRGSNRAMVAKSQEAFDIPHEDDKPAHLVFRDRDRDFAIFCLDDQEPQTHCLELDQNFPGVDQLNFSTHLASRRAFTIGYHTRHKKEEFPDARKLVIQNLTPEKKSRAEAFPEILVDFYEIFRPDFKTLSVGRLDSNPPSNNETTWRHRISGWHGISGGMIACLDKSSTGDVKVQVLGLFTRGIQGNNHLMVMLTSQILHDIRQIIQSHTTT